MNDLPQRQESFGALLRKRALLFLAVLLVSLSAIWIATENPFARTPTPKTAAQQLAPLVAPIPESGAAPIEEEPEEEPSEEKKSRHLSHRVFVKSMPDTLPALTFEPQMLQALYEQANYLRRKDVPKRGASGITKKEMLRTVELLSQVQLLDPGVLLTTFDFYRIKTDLRSDKVRITGYYTPLIKASRERTPEFQTPLMKWPESGVPSPAAIKAGALEGKGLELAWLGAPKELSNAQLQGSCLVEFPDGKRKHFGFGGSVRGLGGSYVFFKDVGEQVLGCGYFPLTAGYSVAVDPRFIPIGATLLAELPNIAPNGKLNGYTYRIIFAQDRGGAILTTKRMDLYCGIGQKGLNEAKKVNRFGRLWVLLPKEK